MENITPEVAQNTEVIQVSVNATRLFYLAAPGFLPGSRSQTVSLSAKNDIRQLWQGCIEAEGSLVIVLNVALVSPEHLDQILLDLGQMLQE